MQLKEQHKRSFITCSALIVAILSLFHFVVLAFSVTLAQQNDAYIKKLDPFASPFNIELITAEAVLLGVLGGVQFFSCLGILFVNCSQGRSGLIVILSFLALMCAVGLGTNDSIKGINYNLVVQDTDQNTSTNFPSLIPYYYCLQVDALITFLFSVPLLLFIFYNKLQSYLKKLQEQRPNKAPSIVHAIWIALLVDVGIHIALIANIYQFNANEDPGSYASQGIANPSTFFIIVQVLITFITFIVLVIHFKPFSAEGSFKFFLQRRHLILMVAASTLLQFGCLDIMIIATNQMYVFKNHATKNNCFFNNCAAADKYRDQLTAYTVVTSVTVFLQIVYMFFLPTVGQEGESKETILTMTERNSGRVQQ